MKKKTLKLILFLLVLLSILTFMGYWFLIQMMNTLSASNETETIVTSTETETEYETESEMETPVVIVPVSYAEKCKLDYVEKPVKMELLNH